MKNQYKLNIKRVGQTCREIYTYNDLDKSLDYYELAVGNPTIDRMHLVDTKGKFYGSWGTRHS